MESWMKKLKQENDLWNIENVKYLPNGLKQEYSRLFDLMENDNLFGVFLQTKDLFEILIKIPTLSFLAYEFSKDSLEKGEWLFKFFEKDLAFGDWNTIGGFYAKNISDPDVKKYFENWYNLIEKKQVVKWRNDWIGHGALAQEDNKEFNLALSEKVGELLGFVQENINIIKKYILVIDNGQCKFEYANKCINFTPWVIYQNGKTYFFDSYKAKKKKTCYLDYENGGKIDINDNTINSFLSKLLVQNSARTFVESRMEEIVLLSEDKLIRDLEKSEDYVRPEYLCSTMDDFMKEDRGIMLIQMPEGYGKTLFSYALDGNGQGKIKEEGCLIRTYYVNDTYASNIDYFASTIGDIFRTDAEGKLLFRGRIPFFNFHDDDKSNSLVSLLEFYKNNIKESKLLLVIDGLDEIKKQKDGSILDYLPDGDKLPSGIYIICTCRTDEELTQSNELFIKLHSMNFTRKLVIDKEDKGYIDILKKFIKKKIGNKDDTQYNKIIEAGNFQFKKIDYICRHIQETNSELIDENILMEWNFEYLNRLFGDKYFHNLVSFCLYMKLLNRPITINQLCLGAIGEETSMQDLYFLWYLKDIIQLDRNSVGNKLSIKSESANKWLDANYRDSISQKAKSLMDEYINGEVENELKVSQSILNIINHLDYTIDKQSAKSILKKINKNIKALDNQAVSNVPDLIDLHQTGQEIAKMADLKNLSCYIFEDDSIQAELFELYGMVGESEQKYKECLSKSSIMDSSITPISANVLVKYALLLDKMKKYQDALLILNKVISHKDLADKQIMGIALANRAQIYFKDGNYEFAKKDIDNAIGLLKFDSDTISEKYHLSLCYLNRCTIDYYLDGNLTKAQEDAKYALMLTNDQETTNIIVNRARTLLNYSFVLHKKGESIEKLIPIIDEAIDLVKDIYKKDELFDIDVLINAYCNKGIILKEHDDKTAKLYFNKAAILCENLLNQKRCYIMFELYKTYHLLLEDDKSYLEKVNNLLCMAEPDDESNCNWVFIALRELILNEYKISHIIGIMQSFLTVIEEKKRYLLEDSSICIVASAVGIYDYLKKDNKYDEACKLLLQVVNIMDVYNIDIQTKTFFKKEIGFLYVKQNQLNEGRKYYEESIKEFEQYYNQNVIEEMDEYIMVCTNLGIVYIALNEKQKAYNILLRAITLIKEQIEKKKDIDVNVLQCISYYLIGLERMEL